MIGPPLEPTDESREWAALYVLDLLSPAEKAAFEDHLRQGCPACQAELQSFQNLAGQLGFAAAPARPSAELRERLLRRVREAPAREQVPQKPGVLLDQAGLLIARAVEIPRQPVGPGITSKPLFVDPGRKYVTALMRMDPGTRHPSHRHRDVEELYLLEGDLHVEGHVMRAGDYCRAEPESIHGETYTQSGCLFLVMASQQNELLA